MGFFSDMREGWEDLKHEVQRHKNEVKEVWGETKDSLGDIKFGVQRRTNELKDVFGIKTANPTGQQLPAKNEPANSREAVALYQQKQQDYYDMLTQRLAWQQEKEKKELWLQGEQQRFSYDLQCKQIAMEKELRSYELQLQHQSVMNAQQIEIADLKLEIERLQLLLES